MGEESEYSSVLDEIVRDVIYGDTAKYAIGNDLINVSYEVDGGITYTTTTFDSSRLKNCAKKFGFPMISVIKNTAKEFSDYIYRNQWAAFIDGWATPKGIGNQEVDEDGNYYCSFKTLIHFLQHADNWTKDGPNPKMINAHKNQLFLKSLKAYEQSLINEIEMFCMNKYGLNTPPDFEFKLDYTAVSNIFKNNGGTLQLGDSHLKSLIAKPTGVSKIGPFTVVTKSLNHAERLRARKILKSEENVNRQMKELESHYVQEITYCLLSRTSFQELKDMIASSVVAMFQ